MRRLCDATHALARRAQSGEWGRALVDPHLSLDDHPELAGLPAELRYAHGVRLIAEQAPLRIVPGELIVGSATLQPATRHVLPVYAGGKPAFGSSSHTTLGFDYALKVGYAGLRREIEERLGRGGLDQKGHDLLQAMLICLDAATTWHRRYLEALDGLTGPLSPRERAGVRGSSADKAHCERVRAALAPVPEQPPATFHQAVQSLWFMFAFQRLCGNWPGIGRVDEMLGPYLEADLAAGRLTLDQAREIIAHMWIKGCEWVGAPDAFGGSGDGQYYQNVILSGVDAEGNDVTNPVTWLILDVVEELRISDFPIAVRIGRRTPEPLLRRVAELQRLGGGAVAVYNEDTVLEGLTRFGYPLEVARRFANDGCWEIQIPGETCFAYRPFDALVLLQQVLGVVGDEPADFPDFESLYAAYVDRLAAQVEAIHREADGFARGGGPSTLFSLLERDCIERARGYYDRGCRYTVYAPHAGGLPNVANSLLAIRRLVYESGEMTLPELVAHLRADWAGAEGLRRRILAESEFYGNDSPAADAMMRRVFDDYLALVGKVREREGVLRPPGISTFGREIAWRGERGATADGHHAGELLATNFSPSPGTDRTGPTAVIRSHCRMGLERLTNGTALELKMHPSALEGETGLAALVGLLRTFVELGGIFMHVDCVSNDTLRDAQAHPERYANLAVRISGWSARFVTLNREWQEMIIRRTEQAGG